MNLRGHINAAMDWLDDLAWWFAMFGRRDEACAALGNVQEAATALDYAGVCGDGFAHDVVIDRLDMIEDAKIELKKADALLRGLADYDDPEKTLPPKSRGPACLS